MPDDKLKERVENLRKRLDSPPDDKPVEAVQPLMIMKSQPFKITVGELLAACADHPDHPNVRVFKKAVAGMTEDHVVNVDRVDLEAILDNKAVLYSQVIAEHEGNLHNMASKDLGDEITEDTARDMELGGLESRIRLPANQPVELVPGKPTYMTPDGPTNTPRAPGPAVDPSKPLPNS